MIVQAKVTRGASNHVGRMEMKEPVDHIVRPQLPWRIGELGVTECGYDASKVKTITRPELVERLKDYGQQRTAMLTCMTCMDTAQRWSDWTTDNRQAVDREIAWERRSDHGDRLRHELNAVAALIERYRAEFDALVAEQSEREAWQARKEAKEKQRAASRKVRW
jgi:hypothetical protein